MGKKIVNDESLTSIANTIRTKGGTSEQLVFPEGFNEAINNIQTGGAEKPPYDLNHFYPAKFYLYTGDSLNNLVSGGGSKYTSMDSMFNGCEKLKAIPLIDTSNATRMDNMFNSCFNLTTIPLIDTSNVTNIQGMFAFCFNLTTIPLIDTSNVTNMGTMFTNCKNLTEIPAFDCSKVTNMDGMLGWSWSPNAMPNLTAIHLKNINTNLDISPVNDTLTREALLEVINNLMDRNGQSQMTLTLGPTLLGKLTEDDKKIATDKNWLLA